MAIIKPIGDDTVYSEQLSSSFYEYHIDVGDEILYAGKSYKYPDENIGEVLVNDVAENFLSNHISFVAGSKPMTDYVKQFDLKTSTGSTTNYIFYNDWSYRTAKKLLNDPINGKIDSRQYFLANYLTLGTATPVRYKLNSGTTSTLISSHSGYNAWSYTGKFSAACGSKLTITAGTESLTYTFDSKDYCLYYVNAYGGWDSLLIDGNAKKTDQITASEKYVKKAKTNSLEFGKTKYLNTIVPSWTLYTGYMTDEQASKMFHLLESTEVYLHNLNDDTITPVLITDTSCEYKTYTNNGKTLPSYIINVEASQEQYRK